MIDGPHFQEHVEKTILAKALLFVDFHKNAHLTPVCARYLLTFSPVHLP